MTCGLYARRGGLEIFIRVLCFVHQFFSRKTSSSKSTIMASESSTKKALESLQFEELAILNERKEALKKDHEAYVAAHPEIKSLLSAFMAALLLEKPDDVLAFAQRHFATYKPQAADVRIVVIITLYRRFGCCRRQSSGGTDEQNTHSLTHSCVIERSWSRS